MAGRLDVTARQSSAGELGEGPLEVRKRDRGIHCEPLELVEGRQVGRIDGVVAVRPTRSDDVHRWLVCFHVARLDRRRVRPQQQLVGWVTVVHVHGVGFEAPRVIRRGVEGIEVVPSQFVFRSFGDVVAEPDEDVADLVHHLLDEVQSAGRKHLLVHGDVNRLGHQPACLSIAGPGATNLLTGLWDANVDRSPVIALTGQVETQVLGPGAFQEVDLAAAFGAVSAWSQTVLSGSRHAELMSLAIGLVHHDSAPFADIREITEVAAEERRSA